MTVTLQLNTMFGEQFSTEVIMASGDKISRSYFPTSYQSYSFTFYKESQYYYIRSESWAVRAEVPSAFLADWHGSIKVARWTGSGWDTVFDQYMQDTNSNKSAYAKINADSLSLSAILTYSTNTETHNLWRVFFDHDQWGSTNGLDVTFYIGSCGTISSTMYNNNLKGKYFYSNGTIGQTRCGLLASGSSSKTNTEVLSYFSSQKGTKIYAAYDRYIVGELRT